ncbi:MAG: hypothetical protein JST37_01225 [Bacteroidetes bacterium]|nr:hypothetical protein [Bacteroidota bacterium]MBS1979882.1 hypothetical protein [Bacteroidota bacterium]
MKTKLLISFLCFATYGLHAQNSLTVSTPFIFSSVKVKDNWTPPTSPVYKEFLSGSTLGYGLQATYSFHPSLILQNKNLTMDVGLGYFNQRFNIQRPFNYNSFIYIIYYTKHYTYNNVDLSLGLTYKTSFDNKYFIRANISYHSLHTFRQVYTPTYTSPNRGFDGYSQINHKSIDFGTKINCTVELDRITNEKFSIGIGLLAPLYIRWRNDAIFDDNPNTFYNPLFSLGFNLSVTYCLSKPIKK